MQKRKISLLLLAGLLLQSGCTTIDPQLSIDVESGQRYEAPNMGETKMPKEEWWRDFEVDELTALIEQGLKESPDILVAFERIEQAQIARNNAAAPLLPSVDLKAGSSLSNRDGANTNAITSKATNAELGLSYELDVWGRIRSGVRLADANIAISKYDYEAIKLTLASNVAQNYLYYQSTLQRVAIAQNNLDIAQKVLAVMEARLRYGAINALDVSRQKATLYTQKSNLINLQNQLLAHKNALAILIGIAPNKLHLKPYSLDDIATPSIDAGLPSELLLRRPDIAASRAAINASKASIQIADAAWYPSFSLSSAAGVSSNALLALSNPLYGLSAGVGMSYNIFDDGRLTNAIRIEKSKAKVALQNYKITLLQAFKEVEDALNDIQYTNENLELTKKTLQEAAYTFDLATIQYKNGRIDFTTFLDVQQTYFSAQERFLLAEQDKLLSLITLYKALGGGFEATKC